MAKLMTAPATVPLTVEGRAALTAPALELLLCDWPFQHVLDRGVLSKPYRWALTFR